MIRANSRIKFTPDDYSFVLETLVGTPESEISLVNLLAEDSTRDEILDHERIHRRLMESPVCFNVSPAFYFYIVCRRALLEAKIDDRNLADYVASVLEEFVQTAHLHRIPEAPGLPLHYLSDMLIQIRNSSPDVAFAIQAHIGNFTLFLSGVFHESIEHRARYRSSPPLDFYESMGRTQFQVLAHHRLAREFELETVYDRLARQFVEVRGVVSSISDRLMHWGHAPSGIDLMSP
ncbi:MAG: hypothetical protein SFY92_07470 [Verrucomicrobiae bacterium]|nr:hypothetical protein [Verrucomicrobiae bacterium]